VGASAMVSSAGSLSLSDSRAVFDPATTAGARSMTENSLGAPGTVAPTVGTAGAAALAAGPDRTPDESGASLATASSSEGATASEYPAADGELAGGSTERLSESPDSPVRFTPSKLGENAGGVPTALAATSAVSGTPSHTATPPLPPTPPGERKGSVHVAGNEAVGVAGVAVQPAALPPAAAPARARPSRGSASRGGLLLHPAAGVQLAPPLVLRAAPSPSATLSSPSAISGGGGAHGRGGSVGSLTPAPRSIARQLECMRAHLAQLREDARTIAGSGEALHSVVNDLTDLSRLRSGRFELRPQTVSLRRIVQNAADLHASLSRSSITFQVHPQLPDILFVDPTRVFQLLSNGLTNAVKHVANANGDVRIAAWVDDGPLPPPAIAVRSNGGGQVCDETGLLGTLHLVHGGVAQATSRPGYVRCRVHAVPANSWYGMHAPVYEEHGLGGAGVALPAQPQPKPVPPPTAPDAEPTVVDVKLPAGGSQSPTLEPPPGWRLAWLVLEVSDTGTGLGGMPGHMLFEPFKQGGTGARRTSPAPAPQRLGKAGGRGGDLHTLPSPASRGRLLGGLEWMRGRGRRAGAAAASGGEVELGSLPPGRLAAADISTRTPTVDAAPPPGPPASRSDLPTAPPPPPNPLSTPRSTPAATTTTTAAPPSAFAHQPSGAALSAVTAANRAKIGSGLGLSLAGLLTTTMGGQVALCEQFGRTRLLFRLPLWMRGGGDGAPASGSEVTPITDGSVSAGGGVRLAGAAHPVTVAVVSAASGGLVTEVESDGELTAAGSTGHSYPSDVTRAGASSSLA